MDDEDLRQKLRSLFIQEDLDRIDGLVADETMGSTIEEIMRTLVKSSFFLPSVQVYIVKGWLKIGKHDDWIKRNLQRGHGNENSIILDGVKKDLGLIPESEHKKKER
jgi:hypothetical protein